MDVANHETGLPLVSISGQPRERGEQYGGLAKKYIDSSISFYSSAFEEKSGVKWGDILDRSEAWVTRAQEYAPDLVEEVRGIAAGSGREFLEIMAINARSEIVYDKNFSDLIGGECTAYALSPQASGDGHSYVGQNWDYLSGTVDSLVMLRVQSPTAPDIIMQIEAGQVGRTGANSAGIGLQANGLGGRYGFRGFGVPQPFIRRKVLESWSLKEALSRVFDAPHQVAANYLLASREGVALSLEVTPGERIGWIYPDDDGLLVHGNHHEAHIPVGQPEPYKPMSMSSLYRVPIMKRELRKVLETEDSASTRKVIAEALSNCEFAPFGVCAEPDPSVPDHEKWQTVASTIVDLSTGEYLLAAGMPDQRSFVTLPWRLYPSTK